MGTLGAGALALAAAVVAGMSGPIAAPVTGSSGQAEIVMVHADSIGDAVRAVRRSGMTIVDQFDRVNVVVARGFPSQVRSVSSDRRVIGVEADQPLRLLSTTGPTATGAQFVHDNPTVFQDARGRPIDGRGVTIAVIDSGVDPTHPMLRGRVVRNLRFIGDNAQEFVPPVGNASVGFRDAQWVDMHNLDSDSLAVGGHGTHVAGIAAGNPESFRGQPIQGAAPRAKIAMLGVSAALSVYGSDAALYWVLEHHAAPCQRKDGYWFTNEDCPPIRVVNNSYGVADGSSEFDATRTTSMIQDALLDEGVVSVWANGDADDGGPVSRSNGFALDPRNGVISVGFTNDAGTGDQEQPVYYDSSTGQFGRVDTYPDLVAPGVAIVSSCRPTMPICQINLDADPQRIDGNERVALPSSLNYRALTGSSMAAPAVSGIVAMLLQADPTLTPAEVELVLENTAHRFKNRSGYEPDRPARNNSSLTSFDAGHGLVDASAALAAVMHRSAASRPSCAPAGPVLLDPPLDADIVESVSSPVPSAPNLDVRSLALGWDASGTLHADLRVTNLAAAPAGQGFGPIWLVWFDHGGTRYALHADRLGQPTSATFTDLATGQAEGDAAVVFDAARNVVRWTVHPSAAAGFSAGDVLSAVAAEGDRTSTPPPLVPVADPTDYANSMCLYALGGSVFASPTVAAAPEPAAATVSLNAPFTLTRPLSRSVDEPLPDDECLLPTVVCDHFRIRIVTDGAHPLAFTTTATTPAKNNVDLWVIGPDGQRWRSNGPSANEGITVTNAPAGTYSVTVEQQKTQANGVWQLSVALT